jgi:sec-independent protein translocase protein TatA
MTTGLLNPTHIILLLLVALIILGPKRLPQAGRSLGRGMREFRDGISGRDDPSEQTLPPGSADDTSRRSA